MDYGRGVRVNKLPERSEGLEVEGEVDPMNSHASVSLEAGLARGPLRDNMNIVADGNLDPGQVEVEGLEPEGGLPSNRILRHDTYDSRRVQTASGSFG